MDSLTAQFNNMNLGLKVSCQDTEAVKKIFALLDELNDDVNLMFTEHGLKIQTMDTSHVALSTVKISKGFFTEYVVPTFTAIGVKISTITRVLGCIDGGFSFEYSEDTPDNLIMRSETQNFMLNTIDLDSEEIETPEAEYDVEIDAESSVIQKYFKNLSLFGDSVSVTSNDDNVFLSTSGDLGKVSFKVVGQRVKINGTLNAKFSARYLVTFAKAASLSKTSQLRFANEQPVLIRYEFGPDSFISFFLAPKIMDDDDDEE
jgi:proliferating cell nuclear antigen